MSNILKKVCSAQKQYCAEHADSMESGNVEERNRHYRSLKMQAAGAWLFAVPLLLLSIFRDHVTYGNEIQMLLAIPVLLFFRRISLYRCLETVPYGAHYYGYADCFQHVRGFPFQFVQHVLS